MHHTHSMKTPGNKVNTPLIYDHCLHVCNDFTWTVIDCGVAWKGDRGCQTYKPKVNLQ